MCAITPSSNNGIKIWLAPVMSVGYMKAVADNHFSGKCTPKSIYSAMET